MGYVLRYQSEMRLMGQLQRYLQDLQLVVPVLSLWLQGEVCGVLVRCVVPQGELDCTAVDTRAFAVCACKAGEPGNTTKELALDSRRALRSSIGLVKEDRAARTTVVGHLKIAIYQLVQGGNTDGA